MTPTLPAPLLRFVAEELARAPALIERVIFMTLNQLRQPRDKLLNSQEQRVFGDLALGLSQHRERTAAAFIEALRNLVHQDLARQHEGYMATGETAEPSRLTLMDDIDLAADVELARVLEQINDVAEWEQRELQTFTSSIAGLDHVEPESNPVRGEIMARALWYAADALPMSKGHQVLFLHVGGEALAAVLKLQYAAASTRIEAHGITPSRYRTGVPPTMTASSEALNPGSTSRSAPSLPSRVPTLDVALETVPMALADTELPPGPGGIVLPHSTAAELQAARAAVVRQVTELVNRTFDGFEADRALHGELRVVLRGLRDVVLRQALQDPGMLDDRRHPAWMLLERLIYQSNCRPNHHDPRLAAYVSFASGLLDGSSALGDPGPEPLRRCADKLDAFALRQFNEQLIESANEIANLQESERRDVAAREPSDPMSVIFSPLTPQRSADARTAPGASLNTVPVDMDAVTGAQDDKPAAPRGETSATWLDRQQPGRWYRLFVRGRWTQAQLLWRSARAEQWLFSGESSQQADPMSRRALLKLRDDSLIQSFDERRAPAAAAGVSTRSPNSTPATLPRDSTR